MDNAIKTCKLCQSSNREEANYCRSCGSLLVENCPRCEFTVNQEMHFRDNCGLMLVESARKIEDLPTLKKTLLC